MGLPDADPDSGVIDLLLNDHEVIRNLLACVEVTGDEELHLVLAELCQSLVRHEVVEELVIFPVVCSEVPEGKADAEACAEDHLAIEACLRRAEESASVPEQLRAQLIGLRTRVLGHFAHEEGTFVGVLASSLTSRRLDELRDLYLRSLAAADRDTEPYDALVARLRSAMRQVR